MPSPHSSLHRNAVEEKMRIRNGASFYNLTGRFGSWIARRGSTDDLRKFVRMCCVSAIVNGIGYALYLLLTYNGLTPKLAATICFAAGVAVGFILNRQWAFRDPKYIRQTLPRYVIAYAIAYVVNIAGLYLFVDVFGYVHQIVQLMLALVIALGLYVTLRYWIFSGTLPESPRNQSVE
jgi:putative flippase GtrA